MSYCIFYRSMFVNTKRGIIPMIESGDNNVWETYRNRRSRSWHSYQFDGVSNFYTHDEIFSYIEEWNEDYKNRLAEDLNSELEWKRQGGSFGFYEALAVEGKHTTTTNFSDVKRFFRDGEKLMVSVDEAIKRLGLHIRYYGGEEDSLAVNTKRFKSEEEMYKFIDEELVGKSFWFTYDEYVANSVYEWKKAVSCLISNKGGGKKDGRKYIIMVYLRENGGTDMYVGVKDDSLFLTSSADEAHIFNKQKAGGKDVYDIIFRTFQEVNRCHFEYDYEKVLKKC